MIKLTKTIKSERKAIKEIEPMMIELRNKILIKDDKFYNMLIAVTEAVNNAIIHGNKCNPQKEVLINITGKKEKIIISIRDEGKGFNLNDIADPRHPDNLLKENGRGVFLIKEICDSVSYNFDDKGTLVTMQFCLN